MKKQTFVATETQNKGKQIMDYSGKTIYVGIDIHLKDWQVTKRCDHMSLGTFRMNGKTEGLIKHLKSFYPGATFKCAYESGAWGFNLQRQLTARGIDCIVIHAADLPSTDKDRVNKTDKVDAKRLAEHHEAGLLKAIHVPSEELQKHRALSRFRKQTVENLTAYRNQLKSLLKYQGIDIPERFPKGCWSGKFMEWVEQVGHNDPMLEPTILLMHKAIINQKNLLLETGRKLKELMKSKTYQQQARLATSVVGIGDVTAAQILLEIGDVSRFPNSDKLNNYIGFYPGSSDSGDKERSTGITPRRHKRLRTALIESAWVAIKHDPAMMEYYKKLTKRMEANRAIIRIARKLLARLRTVLLTGIPYQKGVIA